LRTSCGSWLACANTEMPACCSTLDWVNLAVSAAKSASCMVLRYAVRFCTVDCRLLTVDVNRFWMAPN
jgi:hypothetical protein